MSIATRTVTHRVKQTFALGAGLLAGTFMLACGEDLVLGDDEAFMTEIDDNGGGGGGNIEGNGCDMSGTWVAQINTISEALGTFEAKSYNWFYYELDDTGDEVIVERGWDCGFVVCNVTEIELSTKQSAVLSLHNRQDGVLQADPDDIMEPVSEDLVVDPRKITFKENGDGTCEFSMERWWWLRSAPISFLPDRSDYATLTIGEQQIAQPLPEDADSLPAGSTEPSAGSYTPWDWDEDGGVGLNLQLDKPMVGSRDSIQRDWNEVEATRVIDGSEDFTVPAQFDNEETLYAASNPLLDQISTPKTSGHTFRFVKVSDKAPEDLEGFLNYCDQQVAKHFKKEANRDYCDMRRPRVTEVDGDSDGEE